MSSLYLICLIFPLVERLPFTYYVLVTLPWFFIVEAFIWMSDMGPSAGVYVFMCVLRAYRVQVGSSLMINSGSGLDRTSMRQVSP